MSRATFARRMPLSRTATAVLESAEPEETQEPAVRRSLEVGSADDHAEHEADAVAERVLGRLASAERHEHAPGCGHDDAVRRAPEPSGSGPIGAAGGTLDAESSGAIESARGGGSPLDAGVRREMEAGFGHSLGSIRIHTDTRADQLSRQMSARAFTTGRDIFFARGEYDPASASGRHTLAHELAHTVQDGGSVHRRLRGTADALESQGGEGNTTKGLRKKIGAHTNWDTIVASTRGYEAQEHQLTSNGTPSQSQLKAAQPGMLKLLKKVRDAVKDWKKANKSGDEDERLDKETKFRKDAPSRGHAPMELEDVRSKAGRRQAVNMLEPRVNNEINLLSAKDGAGWLSSLGLSPDKVIGVGAIKEGQVNKVQELHYSNGNGGTFSGYFKEDKGFAKEIQLQEEEVGIKNQDPNYGARAVALYRLDQLFGAGVTARAEFAVHTNEQGQSRLGTVLETAQGESGSDARFKLPGDEGEGVNLDDPVLQSGLNKLQLLDAIAGQLDRHSGNWKVQQDESGQVTGVTGIDLDMSFGKSMKTTATFGTAFNYKGLPEYVDKAMGEKILQVKPTDIRNALLGLLSKAEIEATVSRFTEVQEAVREARKAGKLVDKWDGTTARGGSGVNAKTRYDDAKNYQQQSRIARAMVFDAKVIEEVDHWKKQWYRKSAWSNMPDAFYKTIDDGLMASWTYKGRANAPVVQFLTHHMFENDLLDKNVGAMAKVLVDSWFSLWDPNKLAVEIQELPDSLAQAQMGTRLREEILAMYAQRGAELHKKFDALGKR